ncbi:hypothetical protein Ancab_001459, partial [Ancistrocladus abbreviatus]
MAEVTKVTDWREKEEWVRFQEEGELPHSLTTVATFMQTEGDGPASKWAPKGKGGGKSASHEASPRHSATGSPSASPSGL